MERVQVGGVWFDRLNFDAAVAKVIELAMQREMPAHFVVTPNVDHVMRLEQSPELRALYEKAALSLADGMPIVWVSRVNGVGLPERVTGADLLPALCARAAEQGLKVFLLGGPPGAAEVAARRLRAKHPTLHVGTYCPPFGFERDEAENQRILAMVNQEAPDLLFVGVGSPKQELWIGRFRDRLRVGVCLGVGAAIEFEAQLLRRAPHWMQQTGTEWIFRMLSDPRRLVKRYAGNASFLKVVAGEFGRRRRHDQEKKRA